MERRWWETEGSASRPLDWEARLSVGAAHDMDVVVDLAFRLCGSPEETDAYIEWLRQRVLNDVGRRKGDDARTDVEGVGHGGSARFWTLVTVLADAVESAGALGWRRARKVLREADPYVRELS